MTLDELDRLLTAMPPNDIFATGSVEGRLKDLRRHCHPDLFTDPVEKERANRLFVRLGEAADLAKKPIKPISLKSPKRTYQLIDRRAIGDVADVWNATADGNRYLVKISRRSDGVPLLRRESDVLAKLHTAAGDHLLRRYLPLPCEGFDVRDGSLVRRVNVMATDDSLVTMDQLHRRHPRLEGRHAGWLFNRLLSVLGFAHDNGIIHGAVLPCHVLIRPGDHGLVLIGWGQSVDVGQPVVNGCGGCVDWYPVEAKLKMPAGPAFDIFMAARLVLWLLNQNSPPAMIRFLYSCLLEGPAFRPQSAWDLRKEWEGLLEDLYGPKKFVELPM